MFNQSQYNKNKKQRGTAIISALFLMSIVAMLAVTMLTRQNIEVRRTEIIFQEERLLAQLEWVELWAVEQLSAITQQEAQDYIALEQIWAEPLSEFQQEGVWLSGEIIDLQSRFNINNLLANINESTSTEETAFIEETPQNTVEKNAAAEEELKEEEEKEELFDKEKPYTTAWMLARLIRQVTNENLTNAQVITENIMHWVEPEVTEWDKDYLQMALPYQPAHQPLQSLSELRLIRYVEPFMLTALTPYVTAYVAQQKGENVEKENVLFPINVNTTTASVLAAILNIEIAEAERLLSVRPFYSMEKLEEQLTVLNLSTQVAEAIPALSVTSHYFLVKAIARDDRRVLVQYSILNRDQQGNVAVIRQAHGEL